ncbi:IS30 family transposase [Kribbella sp. NPDC051620]|uniref:IS30 family transposase n=1 Tax=Kribbella sp. NPDC051620 TaxID=3364120 RepID=UPI00379726AD
MAETGGVSPGVVLCPPVVPARSTGRRLTIEDREEIARGVAEKVSINEIGRRIGFAASSVKRELDRNKGSRHNARYRAAFRPGHVWIGRPGETKYSPSAAIRRAERLARRPKTAKLAANQLLRDEVQARLKLKDSPQQIAGRLVLDFPDDPEMRVSHETIYQSLYVQGRGALKRELTMCLRTGRAIRKPHRRADERRAQTRITGIVSISERPADVEDRAVPGHWEGDLICGTQNKSAIGTLVERTTGFVILLHLPHDHGAIAVQEAMIHKMAQLPEILLRTLTWDRGIEMANHAQIAAATGLDIYFCDPHSPWQRGTNENTNGLLRQYFPKATDLSGYHPDYLDYVAAQLNNRPRKRHEYQTPAERLDQLLSNPTDTTGIALTS